MGRKKIRRLFGAMAMYVAVLLTACATSEAAKKNASQDYVVTSAELQLELMSYADRYAAVVAQAVVRRDIGQAALEGVVEARDLVPGAEITVELEALDGIHAFRDARTACCQYGKERYPGSSSISHRDSH